VGRQDDFRPVDIAAAAASHCHHIVIVELAESIRGG